MKKVFRNEFVDDYWERRWSEVGADKRSFENLDIYPIKYAELAVRAANNILEMGCGTGRIYFHYKDRGKNIKGIEYSKTAVDNILKGDQDAEVVCGNVLDMPYEDGAFDVVLAFGLYHGIEDIEDIRRAFRESCRVLRPNGKIVFSVRANGLENDLIEYFNKRSNYKKSGETVRKPPQTLISS